MAEIRIKRVPEELKELLRIEARRLGMDVRSVSLMRLWGTHQAPKNGKTAPPTEPPEPAEIAVPEQNESPKDSPRSNSIISKSMGPECPECGTQSLWNKITHRFECPACGFLFKPLRRS